MRVLLTLLALAALAVGLVACGGDDGDGGGGGGPPVTVPANRPATIKGFEYRFEPENVIAESRPGPLPIRFENAGSLAHNLRVFRDGEDIGGTNTFTGGEAETVRIDLQPGEYEMICTVGDHADLGMTGRLTVR